MNRERKFKLHHFPRIPAHIVEGAKDNGGNGDRFRRLFSPVSTQMKGRGQGCSLQATEAAAETVADLQGIESSAYAAGFCKGEQDGIASGRNKVQQAVDSLAAAAEGLIRLQNTFARESETRLVELALAIGRKIVGYEIAANRDVVVNVAREALKSVANLNEVTVKMNPADLAFLQENQVSLSRLAPHISEFRVEAVDGIESGGCVIESASGIVDAQIDSQLQLIEKTFEAELNKINDSDSP